MNIVAIILARGGSKGIRNKNIIDFCGKPLISWTIENCIDSGIENIYVSSDSTEILDISNQYGANIITRPEEFSTDTSTSESAWRHAIGVIEQKQKIDWIFAPQVTSPLREASDIKKGIDIALEGKYDSLFSCSLADDLFFWEEKNNKIESINYDWKNRKRRQDINKQYIENGSFYFFQPRVLIENNNRFGKNIGMVEMEFWKMFEIDSHEDIKMCSALMKEFLI